MRAPCFLLRVAKSPPLNSWALGDTPRSVEDSNADTRRRFRQERWAAIFPSVQVVLKLFEVRKV